MAAALRGLKRIDNPFVALPGMPMRRCWLEGWLQAMGSDSTTMLFEAISDYNRAVSRLAHLCRRLEVENESPAAHNLDARANDDKTS